VPVRFTTIAVLAISLCATSAAVAVRGARAETAPDEDLEGIVVVAGSLGYPPSGVVELGGGSEDVHLYAFGAIAYDVGHTRDEYAWIPGGGAGVDAMWGDDKGTRGFAGPTLCYFHNLDQPSFHADMSFVGLGARVGFDAPITRHVAIRGWAALGVGEIKDSTSGDGHHDTLPFGSLNLGVAVRL
jgi:hypothetical protein